MKEHRSEGGKERRKAGTKEDRRGGTHHALDLRIRELFAGLPVQLGRIPELPARLDLAADVSAWSAAMRRVFVVPATARVRLK